MKLLLSKFFPISTNSKSKPVNSKLSLLVFLSILISSLSYAQNQKKIDSLVLALSKSKIDTTKALLLHQLGNAWEGSDLEKTDKYFKEELELSKRINFNKGIRRANNGFGKILTVKGEFKKAIEIFNENLKFCIQTNDKVGIAEAYDNIGMSNVYLGNYDIAIEYRNKGIEIYKTLNLQESIANGYQWIGNSHLYQSRYTIALDYFLKTLRICEKIKDDEGVAFALISCATVYRHQRNHDKAIEILNNSIPLLEKLGLKSSLATVYNNLGNNYGDKDDKELALKNYLLALKIDKEMNRLHSIVRDYQNIGHYYEEIKNFNLAEKYLQLALKIAVENDYKESEGGVLMNLALLSSDSHKYDKSNNYFKEGLAILKSIKQIEGISICYKGLSNNYSELNNYKQALKYHTLFKEMDDSLKKETSSKTISELQIAYDTEKKDKAISALNIKNLEEKQARQQRETWLWLVGAMAVIALLGAYLLKTRRDFQFTQQISEVRQEALNAQMNDHFISNSMDSINSFIEENDKKQASHYLLTFNRLIRRVLENSFKKTISLDEDLSILEDYISLEKLRFENDSLTHEIIIDKNIDRVTTKVPPMIFQVLAENAIKHAFSKDKGGKLTIKVVKNENKIDCVVEDNGVGRNASNNKSDTKFRTSLGTSIAEKLVKLSGENKTNTSFSINDLLDRQNQPIGTRVTFTIPLKVA